ncbi:MAG: hypothetical protein N2738_06565 [Thermodesulfovibrionales bacterium]|nr:hypothetical protein [Thermodesulfovibrionales bacterium]
MHEFLYSISIKANVKEIFQCITNISNLFLLNPQWHLIHLQKPESLNSGDAFIIKVKYDRTDREEEIKVKIDSYVEPSLFSMTLVCDNSRKIVFNLSQQDEITKIEYKETKEDDFSIEEKREIIYWIRSIGNYYFICKSKTPWGRLWRYFVDKCWLKMSPSGKRMLLFIVIFEILTLLFLVVFIAFKIV